MRLLAASTAKAYASAGTSREQGKKKALQQPDIAFHFFGWEPGKVSKNTNVQEDSVLGKFSLGFYLTVSRTIYTALPSRCLCWCIEVITFNAHDN